MASNTQKLLEEVNEVSRQLLSRILAIQADSNKLLQEQDSINTEENINEKNKVLTQLMAKRQTLITTLFEDSRTEEISSQSVLLQDMVVLDKKLTDTAKLSKQTISEQVIKIKKSNKVTKSYQKY